MQKNFKIYKNSQVIQFYNFMYYVNYFEFINVLYYKFLFVLLKYILIIKLIY